MFRFADRKKARAVSLKPPTRSLIDKLIYSPEQFTFVKAVDVALVSSGVNVATGNDFPIINVSLKSKINFRSKFSDIAVVEGVKDGDIELFTNLYGVAGIDGTFPDCYVEEFIIFNKETRSSISDFLDIFNNKILTLRYRYMKKYDLSCVSSRLKVSIFGCIMFSLSGYSDGCSELIEQSIVPEQFRISCQKLLWNSTRSSEGLEIILSNFFGIQVKIEQFVGDFDQISNPSECSSMGRCLGRFNKLGIDTILGNKTWNAMKGIRVVIGPLQLEKYINFLPKQHFLDQKSSQLRKIKEIIKMYVPNGIKVKMLFCLDKCSVKETFLNGVNRLNRDAFILGHNERDGISFSVDV
jgi:type VI secretion system protein ImpH